MSIVGMLFLLFIAAASSVALFCMMQFESALKEIENCRGK